MSAETFPLPLEVRIGLDVIARTLRVDDGAMSATVIGDPALVESLSDYAMIQPSSDRLILLWAPPHQVVDWIAEKGPEDILELTAGPLHSILAPLRSTSRKFLEKTSVTSPEWSELGYEPAMVYGIQGPAAVFWATAERVARRLGRPDLADRCRVAMLRTMVCARPFHIGSIRVRRLRRRRNGLA